MIVAPDLVAHHQIPVQLVELVVSLPHVTPGQTNNNKTTINKNNKTTINKTNKTTINKQQ